MYNIFSFIWIHFKKWTDGTRKDIVKMLLTASIFVSCFWLLVQWNTIPRYEDSILIETYKDKSVTKDSLYANVSIRRPYQTFYSLSNDSAGYNIYFTGSYKRDTTKFINHNAHVDSLLNVLKTKVSNASMDSIAILFNVKAKIHLYTHMSKPSSTENLQKNKSIKDNVYFNVTYNNSYDSTERAFANGELLGVIKDKYFDTKEEPFFILSPNLENKTSIDWSPLRKLLSTMHDMSQCYYTFRVKTNNVLKQQMGSLSIDFGGATRFSGIYPKPDETTCSGIRYTDKKKLLEIERYGLKVYCQFLESNSVQSLRTYALTTIVTFFFTLFLKMLIEMLWRNFKRLCDNFAIKRK